MTGLFLTRSNVQMLTNTNLRNQALYVARPGSSAHATSSMARWRPDLTALLGAWPRSNPADEFPARSTPSHGLPVGRGAHLDRYRGGGRFRAFAFPPAWRTGRRFLATLRVVPNSLMGILHRIYIRNDTRGMQDWANSPSTAPAAAAIQIVVIRSEGTASDGRTTVVLEMDMGGAGAGAPPRARRHRRGSV